MHLTSIRARMTVAFALAISLLMLLACGSLIAYAQWAAEHKANALLAATMVKIQGDLADNATRIDASDMRDDAKFSGMSLLVTDAQGRPLFKSQPSFAPFSERTDANWCVKVAKLHGNTFVLALPWRDTQQALRRQATLLVLLGFFVTLAATAGAWILVGRTLLPIDSLSQQAQAASAADRHMRLSAPSHDAEIVGLVSTLNGLLARISETVAAKERFHATASHELRTPLQVLSGELELALQRPRSNDEYRQFITSSSQQAQRLSALTHDLLLLHQLDAAEPSPQTDVSLSDVCRRALDWFAVPIQDRNLHLKTHLPSNAMVTATPSHIEMLTRNLVENAVNYTPAHGHVSVHLSDLGTELTIKNDCTALIDDPISHIGGTGLGLTICKALCDANGWSFRMTSTPNSVTIDVLFQVSVPTLS